MANEYVERLQSWWDNCFEPNEEKIWAVIEVVAEVIDVALDEGLDIKTHPAANVVAGVETWKAVVDTNEKHVTITPNPLFLSHGIDGGGSEATDTYLAGRTLKSLGGFAVSLAGSLSSNASLGVDVLGSVKHLNALGSTRSHIKQLQAIAKRYRQSETIGLWLDAIIRMKMAKACARGAQFVAAAFPLPGLGVAGAFVSGVTRIASKMTLTKACLATASQIHWRAYQEQVISGRLFKTTGKVGPASMIMYELFRRPGLTRVFGPYDVDALIREPSGWMAISDKLLLI